MPSCVCRSNIIRARTRFSSSWIVDTARNHDALKVANPPQLLFRWIDGVHLALFPPQTAGVVGLAALDSTVFVSLPFGIDAVVVILAAQLHDFAWTVPFLATAGSIGGAWLTFSMGIKIGEKGIDRFVSAKRLEGILCRILRFGLETLLAVRYGASIVGWLESDLFHGIAALLIFAAIAATAVSLINLIRSTRTTVHPRAHRARA